MAAIIRVDDASFGSDRVIVMCQMHLSQPYEERTVAHPEQTAEHKRAWHDRTVDNRRADVVGAGKVLRRFAATEGTPPRCEVELDD
jgi:hypothetical protein